MIMHLFGQNMFPVTLIQLHICQLFKHMDVTFQNIMAKFFQRDLLLFFSMRILQNVTIGRYGSALDPLGGGGRGLQHPML